MKSSKLLKIMGTMTIMTMGLSGPLNAATVASQTTTRVSVHDPSIVKNGNSYYVFGSHIEAARSTDLQNWTRFTNGYTTPNNVIFDNLSKNLAKSFKWAGMNDVDSKGGYSVWAPDVFWNADYVNEDGSKGAYMMYYCTSSTYKRSCIGYAVSKNIEGPYTYVDTIVYSGFTKEKAYDTGSSINTKYTNTNLKQLINDGDVKSVNSKWFNSDGSYNTSYAPNAIDPTMFYDESGRLWMTYGSWSGGIFLLELDPKTGEAIYPGTTGTTSNGNVKDAYFGVRIAGGYTVSGEGPYIVYDEETDYYYLYVTYGFLSADGGYNMRLFRSKNVDGPYVDAAGNDAALPGNVNHCYAGIKLMGNYNLSALNVGYKAQGHNSAFIDDDGDRYLVYHTRFNGGTEYHEVRVHQQFMNEEGWPVTAVYENRGDQISKTGYDIKDIIGKYEFINHGTEDGTTMLDTLTVSLNQDYTISGDVTGTWSKTAGTYYATFSIDGVSYKGVFFKQKDESSAAKQVMTFTAIGNNNTCIWGSQTEKATYVEEEKLSDTVLKDNGVYTLKNVYTQKCLNVAQSSSSTANVEQWEEQDWSSERFKFVPVGNGYYKLLTAVSGYTQAVGVEDGNSAAGANIIASNDTGSTAQQFKVIQNTDGTYSLLAKCSNDTTCLEVYNFGLDNGTNVSTWTYWGGDLQHWILDEVAESDLEEEVPDEDVDTSSDVKANVSVTTNGEGTTAMTQTYTIAPTKGSIDLSKLKIRYYFSKDDTKNMSMWCDYADVQLGREPWYASIGSNIQGSVKTSNGGYYLELTVDNATTLEANTDKLCIMTRLYNEDWSSLSGIKEQKVEVLYNGQKIN